MHYTLYEGHVKCRQPDTLDEGIAIGCDTLFEDFCAVSICCSFCRNQSRVLEQQNFLAVVVAYNQEKGRLDPYTGSYMFTPILQKYRKELQESSNTKSTRRAALFLGRKPFPNALT